MLALKVVLIVLYFLIGFFFVGAVIKVTDDTINKGYVKVIGVLLYLFFWPVLISIGLGMKVIESVK